MGLPSNNPDYWGTEVLNDNCGHYTVTVPEDIAPGNYLLRSEVIALHVASSVGGAQFYMSCFQVCLMMHTQWVQDNDYIYPRSTLAAAALLRRLASRSRARTPLPTQASSSTYTRHSRPMPVRDSWLLSALSFSLTVPSPRPNTLRDGFTRACHHPMANDRDLEHRDAANDGARTPAGVNFCCTAESDECCCWCYSDCLRPVRRHRLDWLDGVRFRLDVHRAVGVLFTVRSGLSYE